MTPEERALKCWQKIDDRRKNRFVFKVNEERIIATAIREAEDASWQQARQIAVDYSDWTYWGQYDNWTAAEAAATEIAAALEKRRRLTTDEIRELDTAPKRSHTKDAIRDAKDKVYSDVISQIMELGDEYLQRDDMNDVIYGIRYIKDVVDRIIEMKDKT